MDVFTELSDHQHNQIAAAFRLGSLTSAIGIADGDSETTYLFRTANGEFVVTLFENGAEPSSLDQAFLTMDKLLSAGIPCPRTVRTARGDATITIGGKLVAVVGFLQGAQSQSPTLQRFVDLGRNIAKVHLTLKPAVSTTNDLPKGPVHGALHPENVFFLGDLVSGIINFRLRHETIGLMNWPKSSSDGQWIALAVSTPGVLAQSYPAMYVSAP
ncbi:phosphotransferase [Agrobacterium larrymoorei]|uniref:Homoserine kinase n=1 Tax=Agrobacterium larrymoorei TaxID=160699 RepID=A0A4D7DVA5_9HYPH|nr:phosphotransferase [Agrobacterium larrymoorei]QCJ01024.1 homoserine kinase [Agrobacterium larrymoorei]QYA10359.1 homoserine kinase [Agrobacterium larrymoorei]